MLVLTRKKDESIMIGDDIEIIITHIMEDRVKIGIKAPKDKKIYRKEIFEAVENENRNSMNTDISELDVIKNLIKK